MHDYAPTGMINHMGITCVSRILPNELNSLNTWNGVEKNPEKKKSEGLFFWNIIQNLVFLTSRSLNSLILQGFWDFHPGTPETQTF